MTIATVRAAAEHIARTGTITPHQLAALTAHDERLTDEQRQAFSADWRAQGSPAAPSPPPPWLAPALQIIREFEGCRLTAYQDSVGIWTIGWGSTRLIDRPVQQGDVITRELADDLLQNDVEIRYRQLLGLMPVLSYWSANRIAALLSWAYNVGMTAVAESSLRRRIIDREDPLTVIREELPRWNKANGQPLEGLTRRRTAEVALFVGGSAKPFKAPANMIGPTKRPDLKPGDHHLIANDVAETMTAYSHDGKRLWQIPCLCRGQGREAEWNTTGTDTPPGLYLVGTVHRDYEKDPSATFTADRRAYGWFSFDLLGQEGQEGPGSRYGRDGIMIHGGGTACGWPGAWAPRQALHPTLGCIRLHNADLRDRILPLLGLGRIWVSVYQEAG
jgi:GH24 family phage-related lysozyme (muramidase)